MHIGTRWICLLSILFTGLIGAGEDASEPLGEPVEEIPTIHCLGVRWKIKGDANANAEIAVQYRKVSEPEWRQGFPLFRSRPNPHAENTSKKHTVEGGWMFAGSVLGLEPATEYEVKLNLKDPDGGAAEKVLKMTTWQEPVAPADLTTVHVVPGTGGGTGTKEDPFKGLDAAVASAQPGTLFLLHAGTYVKEQCKGDTFVIPKSGAPGKPLVFRAAGDGEVILDGGGDHKKGGRLISANALKHIWLEGLTLRGREYGIVAHEGSHWVIRRCVFREVTKGFTAHNGDETKSQRHFIADNDYLGPTTWPRTKGIESFCLTYMTGAGHVVCHNLIQNTGDAIHGCGHGGLSSTDFYHNDCNICTDDGIETDYADFNVRVWGNRVRNVAHGFTAQPIRGGPVYFFRNVVYNCTYSPFKLHNHTSGVVIFHNTSLRNGGGFNIVPAHETVTNLLLRNNLFLGTGGTGLNVGTPNMRYCDFDNDGYGGFQTFATWNARKTYKTIEDARAGGEIYKDKGAHSIDASTCFASGTKPPADPKVEASPEACDMRLAEKSGAIDKGVVLPNFNDGYKGAAPDLGAFEFGAELPHYGPRAAK